MSGFGVSDAPAHSADYAQGQSNPLTTMNNIVNLQSNMIGMQKAQMQLRAQRALGPILQASVDPSTGKPDINKVFLGVASNPDTAFMAPDIYEHLTNISNAQAELALKQLYLGQKRTEAAGREALSLVQPDAQGNPTKLPSLGDVLNVITSNYASGALGEGKDARDFALNMYTEASKYKDPVQLQQWLLQKGKQAIPAAESMKNVMGQIQTTDTGGAVQIGRSVPMAGVTGGQVYQPGANISKTVTPDQQNALQPGVNQAGQPTLTPRSDVAPMTGAGAPQVTQLNPLTGAPDLQSESSGLGFTPASIGPASSQKAPPSASQAPKPIVSPQAPAGPHVSGLSPYQAGLQKTASEYKDQVDKDAVAATGSLQQIQKMQDTLKDFKPGGGASYRKVLGQLAQGFGAPKGTVDSIANGSLSASQIFEKLSTTNAMQVLRSAIGGQGRLTNLEFAKFLESNPNLDTDPRAVGKMLGYFKKMALVPIAEQQGLAAWNKKGLNPAEFPAYFNKKLLSTGQYRIDPLEPEK